MSKKVFLIFLLMWFVLSCGEEKDVNYYIERGENFLRIGNPDGAREAFQNALNIEENNCSANYGLILSDLLGISSVLSMGSSLITGISPQGGVDTLATQLLSTFEKLLVRIQNSVKSIENSSCRYKFYSLPIFIGEDMFLIMGEWGDGELQLIGGIADLLNGLIHILLSQNYDFDIESFLDAFQKKYKSYEELFEDPLKLIRFIGYIPSTSKEFLQLSVSETRKNLFIKGRDELSSGLSRLKRALEIVFSPDEKDKCPYDDIIMWKDKDDSENLTPGDIIDIRVYRYDPGEWKKEPDKNIKWKYVPEEYKEWKCDNEHIKRGCLPLTEPLCLEDEEVQWVITSIINDDYLKIVKGFLNDLSKSIKGEYQEPITIGRVNELIPPAINDFLKFLGPEIPKIEFKNTLRFNLSKFFKQPRALRDMLPYWSDEDKDTYAEFLIEGESEEPKSIYVKKGDSEHFPEKITFEKKEVLTRIPKDCLAPKKDDPIPLIYIAFQDPSLGELIEIDLSPFEECENDPSYSGWIKPSEIEKRDGIYILNKALNDIIITLNGIIKAVGITGGLK